MRSRSEKKSRASRSCKEKGLPVSCGDLELGLSVREHKHFSRYIPTLGLDQPQRVSPVTPSYHRAPSPLALSRNSEVKAAVVPSALSDTRL